MPSDRESLPRQSAAQAYGKEPQWTGGFELDWAEYMHYLYLPVVMPGGPGLRLPERLGFLKDLVRHVCVQERLFAGDDRFVYVTARRGYATPGNPLNRPGWHCDGFGTDDVNYIWTDRFPTRFAIGAFGEISTDHVKSAEQFEHQIDWHSSGSFPIEVLEGKPNTLYRLDPFVVHSTPIIPPPGGERSFLKVSISRDRYNLCGNSHNYLFDYDWRMWDRAEIRNDPAYAGGDAGPQEVAHAS